MAGKKRTAKKVATKISKRTGKPVRKYTKKPVRKYTKRKKDEGSPGVAEVLAKVAEVLEKIGCREAPATVFDTFFSGEDEKATSSGLAKAEKQLDAMCYVTKAYRKSGVEVGDPESTEDKIGVRKFVTEPAKVMAEAGLTMNMGNYESARLSVAVTVPCYQEELDDAYDFAVKWAGDRLSKEVDRVRGVIKSSKASGSDSGSNPF